MLRAKIAAGARVVPGRLVQLLVPDIEPAWDVPNGLRHREHRQRPWQHLGQVDSGPRAQQAVIVIDKIRVTVIDALMVWHMRVRCMDAHTLGDDLIQRTAGAHEIVIDLARANLVARHDPVFQLAVQGRGVAVRLHVHLNFLWQFLE